MEETDIVAKNGRIFTLAGVLIPPTIVPILPHRCDVTKSQIAMVRKTKKIQWLQLLHATHIKKGGEISISMKYSHLVRSATQIICKQGTTLFCISVSGIWYILFTLATECRPLQLVTFRCFFWYEA